MFKNKTVKLALASILSAAVMQVSAAGTAQQSGNWVDFSDPTAIYSKVGLATGTEGVDVFGALGGYLGGQFEQKLTIEALHDMDFYNVNYLAFNKSNDTGFIVNTRWDSSYDEVAAGVIKKLVFDQNQSLKVYPAMKFGVMWDWDNAIPSTTFVQIDAGIFYNLNRNVWFGGTPTYRYALNGLDVNDVDVTLDVGFQLAEEVAISIHGNNDDEYWADFTFAF